MTRTLLDLVARMRWPSSFAAALVAVAFLPVTLLVDAAGALLHAHRRRTLRQAQAVACHTCGRLVDLHGAWQCPCGRTWAGTVIGCPCGEPAAIRCPCGVSIEIEEWAP